MTRRDQNWDVPREPWVLSAGERQVWQRSLLLEVTVRAVFPTVLVLSLYLLFSGHSSPGGGFAAGLVAGLAFVLRYVVSGTSELSAAVRLPPLALMGGGLALVVLVALAPIAFGHPVLTSAVLPWHSPVFGEVTLASSMVFDIGVYLLVAGGVLDLLRTLGSGISQDGGES